ncbi:Uncharacterized alpha/beta hydrolase domain (DUF2235) domain containing protein [Amanita muscaria]
MKRIIVLCDGTGQCGLSQERSEYTNIMRLARSVNFQDDRKNQPIPQIVSYLPGVGSDANIFSQVIDVDKIESGYGFIAQNYQPGDEVFLFGFSRGAYTARMIATLIGEIGILDRKDMDSFADICRAYKEIGASEDTAEIAKLKSKLFRWTDPKSPGKQRADPDGDGFTIKCIGVFDTVSSIGLPEEMTFTRGIRPLFGVSDKTLGKHVEKGYHALALGEDRADWNCLKFEQTDIGKQKGQILKQCWFAGTHSDIGGGFPEHDLADITLMWMAVSHFTRLFTLYSLVGLQAQVGDMLSLNSEYLSGFTQPVAPWGKQIPHNPRTGVFELTITTPREPPSTDPKTAECVHPSVREQKINPTEDLLQKYPELLYNLTRLEEEWRDNWPYDPQSPQVQLYEEKEKKTPVKNSLDVPKSDAGVKRVKSTKSSNRRSLIIRIMNVVGVGREDTAPSPLSPNHRRSTTRL